MKRYSPTDPSVTSANPAVTSWSGASEHLYFQPEGGLTGLQNTKGRLPEEFTPIDEAVSTSGRYAIAFGQHFRPDLCYDVVAVDRRTGQCTRRHYKTKDEAMTYWQTFKNGMTAKRGPSEEDEHAGFKIFGPN